MNGSDCDAVRASLHKSSKTELISYVSFALKTVLFSIIELFYRENSPFHDARCLFALLRNETSLDIAGK